MADSDGEMPISVMPAGCQKWLDPRVNEVIKLVVLNGAEAIKNRDGHVTEAVAVYRVKMMVDMAPLLSDTVVGLLKEGKFNEAWFSTLENMR
jgi:hypothetical protein